MFRMTCFALTAIVAASATAQTAARPDPADPRASAPARTYESAFKGYLPYDDPELAGWRASNEEMARLGGHLGHVPKAQGLALKPAAKPPSAQGGHGSHK